MMREVCRLFLPLPGPIIEKVGKAFPASMGMMIQTVTRGNEMRLVARTVAAWMAEGDVVQGGVAAFPGYVPDWIAQWYCRGEVGRSAHALATLICGGGASADARLSEPEAGSPARPDCAPYDADDVRRCVEMLKWAPLEERPVIGRIVTELLEEDPEWGRWAQELSAASCLQAPD